MLETTLKNDATRLKCHVIGNVGGVVGPELVCYRLRASRENLLESILYPSRAISDQYVTWVVETKGGMSITGVIAAETPQHLVIRDVRVKEFKIRDQGHRESNEEQSQLMPDNLILHLPEDDLLDIVEYLYSLQRQP